MTLVPSIGLNLKEAAFQTGFSGNLAISYVDKVSNIDSGQPD